MEQREALAALEPLIGDWTLEATGPDGEPWTGQVDVSFAWHESGAFVVQTSMSDMPIPSGVAIIGCDAGNETYFQLYSDDRGVSRVYAMTIGGDEWTLSRDGDPFPQRFTGRFSEDGATITGRHEKAEDGSTFATDFDVVYTRVR